MAPPREVRPPRLWVWLGRLLPVSIRERVYEPTCLDLWNEYRRGSGAGWPGSRLRLGLRFSGRLTQSFWYALPRYCIDAGRLTTLGSVVAILLIVLAGLSAVAVLAYGWSFW